MLDRCDMGAVRSSCEHITECRRRCPDLRDRRHDCDHVSIANRRLPLRGHMHCWKPNLSLRDQADITTFDAAVEERLHRLVTPIEKAREERNARGINFFEAAWTLVDDRHS